MIVIMRSALPPLLSGVDSFRFCFGVLVLMEMTFLLGVVELVCMDCMLESLLVLDSVEDLLRMLIELRLPILQREAREGERGEPWPLLRIRFGRGESSPPPRGELFGEEN